MDLTNYTVQALIGLQNEFDIVVCQNLLQNAGDSFNIREAYSDTWIWMTVFTYAKELQIRNGTINEALRIAIPNKGLI